MCNQGKTGFARPQACLEAVHMPAGCRQRQTNCPHAAEEVEQDVL